MRTTSLLSLACGALAAPALAQDWPHWRGPNYDGSTEARGLPTEFDREQGLRWSAELPGPGASTPVVQGDHVYLTSVDGEKLVALCFDRGSGSLAWTHEAGSGYRPGGAGSTTQLHGRSNYASPSPVTDGQRVVFFFGNGDLVCTTTDGERAWARNLQEDHGDFCFQWTFSASPTLHGGRLFVQVLQRDEPVGGRGEAGAESFLLAIDPDTGETLYRHVRPSSARKESLESYATPIPFVGDGREELLVVGGDVITGHDPASGAELWRWGTWNEGNREEWWRLVPSPVVGAGVTLACGPKGSDVVAVQLGGEGELEDDRVAWRKQGRGNPVTTDVPTPLFYEGSFYVLSDLRSNLSKLAADSGEVEWTVELPRDYKWRASPTGADGKVWIMDHHGDVLVLDAGDGSVVGRASMGRADDDGIRSSISVAHGALFIRVNDRLFCVGNRG